MKCTANCSSANLSEADSHSETELRPQKYASHSSMNFLLFNHLPHFKQRLLLKPPTHQLNAYRQP